MGTVVGHFHTVLPPQFFECSLKSFFLLQLEAQAALDFQSSEEMLNTT